MEIKQKPEDFYVEEIPEIKPTKKGPYIICELIKKDYNTENAIQEITKQLNIPRKHIGFAGTKDRKAITKQQITIKTNPEKIQKFKHKNITLKYINKNEEPLSLGRLKGNKFKITIRNLNGTEKIQNKKIINYFHKQRFSKNNTEIGKHLIKKQYKEAVQILQEDNTYKHKINEHLKKSNNDYVGALKTLPKKILTLYAHAYQSKIWNETIQELKKQNKLPENVPIPGFSPYQTDKDTEEIITKIMKKEQITQKDYLNKDIPSLCIEGTTRKTTTNTKNLKIHEYKEDELNPNKKKITIEFELGKGEYATNAIEQLFE